MATDVVVAKSEGFGYGGEFKFAGEIMPLRGFPGDNRLLQLGYLTLYDQSLHDKSAECTDMGKRFVSQAHRVSFRERLADQEAADEMRARARSLPDQENLEGDALARSGVAMSENKGSVKYAGADVAKSPEPDPKAKQPCPVDDCESAVLPQNMRRHVAAHMRQAEKTGAAAAAS